MGVLLWSLTAATSASSESSTTPIQITATQVARLRLNAPPPSRGPHPIETDVSFADARRGLLATGRPGTVPVARGVGRIELTQDGGRTWATVWSRRSVVVSWVGFLDRTHAFGAASVETQTRDGSSGPSSPLLLHSEDGGQNWSVFRPVVPTSTLPFFSWGALRFQFVSRSVGFGIRDPYVPGVGRPILRTTDGGRHWTALRTPFAPSSLRFLNAQVGYATGVLSTGRGCWSEVFRTTDGGTSWQGLKQTCRPYDLWGIDVLDARHLFVGGGQGYWTENARQAVLSTADGGRSWRTLYNAPTGNAGLPIVELHFIDRRHAWALTGSCKMGANGPCAGEVLVSSSGGRSWRETGQFAVRLATIGRRLAWTTGGGHGEPGGTVVWRSADTGRSWQPLVRPEGMSPLGVEAAGAWVIANSAIGLVRSTDDGQTWSHFNQPGVDPGRPFVIRPGLIAVPDYRGALRLSRDDGRSWTRVAVVPKPWNGIDAVAFENASHGLVAGQGETCTKGGEVPSPIYSTRDGGRTFRHLADVPVSIESLALQGELAVGTGFGSCEVDLVISRDGGMSWQIEEFPRGVFCESAAITPRAILLACGTALFVSRDGGTTWTKLLTPRAELGSLAASGTRVWAAGRMYDQAGSRALWRSDDEGSSWVETWIAPPRN